MTIYYVLYLLTGVFTAITYASYKKDKIKANKVIAWIIFVMLLLVLGLRHHTMGVDLQGSTGYLRSFEKIASYSWTYVFSLDSFLNYEFGFIILNKLIGVVSNDYNFYLFVMAFLMLLPVAITISKRSDFPALSYVIYLGLPVFLILFSGMRQGIAISMCFLSLDFIQQKKWVKFILIVLFASLFHYTATIFLLAYPIYYIKLKNFPRTISIIMLPIVYIFRYSIFSVLSRLFRDNVTVDDNGAFSLMLLFWLIYLFVMLYNDKSEEQNGLMNFFYVACLCQTFSGIYSTAMRVGYYFMIFLILLLPNILNKMTQKENRIFWTSIVTVCFIGFGWYLIYFSRNSWSMASPYYFFFESRYL